MGTKIMYRAFHGLIGVNIDKIEVVKETEHFIQIKGRTGKDKKNTDWYNTHSTFDEAAETILSKQNSRVQSAKDALDNALAVAQKRHDDELAKLEKVKAEIEETRKEFGLGGVKS